MYEAIIVAGHSFSGGPATSGASCMAGHSFSGGPATYEAVIVAGHGAAGPEGGGTLMNLAEGTAKNGRF